MNRTNVWEYDETKELLNIMVEQDSIKHFHGKTYTATAIYKKIEEDLKKRGYPNKNEKQIENRWKNLKKRYRHVKKINCEIGTERSLCPFYDELNSMLEDYYDESSNKKCDWDDDEEEEGPPPPRKKIKWEYEEVKDKVPVKRNIWEYEETKALLNIMIEQESLKHFNGKLYKNAEIYKNIEIELKKKGFHNKNDKQIEHRWKNLKKEFCKVKKMNTNCNEINLCPFYDELDNMLNNRTSTANSSDNGVDASKSIFFEENNDGLFLEESSSPAIDEDKMFNVPTSPKQRSPSSSPAEKATTSDFQKRPLRGKSIYSSQFEKLGQRIKKTQEELTKQFFEDQKRLIDYEYNLYLKSEEEFQKKFDESTRKILEDSTKTFLEGLQAILQKNNSNPNTSDISEFIKFSTEDCQ